jgi:6-pyruvoyltetrahydropterin/6-carboxytetrahydropterin synthase
MKLELSTTWSSAHLYNQPLWSAEENDSRFGKCYSHHGHGHDYTLKVCFQIDNPKELKQIKPKLRALLDGIKNNLDHHHLNFVVPEFKDQVPTTENIALYCWQEIEKNGRSQDLPLLESLRLFEKPDLWVEIMR